MKCLQNKFYIVLAILACSIGLTAANQQSDKVSLEDFSPEVQQICQSVKTVFANTDNKISWRCMAGALFHYLDRKKAIHSDGKQNVLKGDPRFAELQSILAEVVDASNLVFIADKLSKYEKIFGEMSLDKLAAILSKRIEYNAHDARDEKGRNKCDYKSIIKLFETARPKGKDL